MYELTKLAYYDEQHIKELTDQAKQKQNVYNETKKTYDDQRTKDINKATILGGVAGLPASFLLGNKQVRPDFPKKGDKLAYGLLLGGLPLGTSFLSRDYATGSFDKRNEELVDRVETTRKEEQEAWNDVMKSML